MRLFMDLFLSVLVCGTNYNNVILLSDTGYIYKRLQIKFWSENIHIIFFLLFLIIQKHDEK